MKKQFKKNIFRVQFEKKMNEEQAMNDIEKYCSRINEVLKTKLRYCPGQDETQKSS